ncbi:hypothetical protein TNCV_122221 [Trichonephila clavipes]|nr:hypothetical protein TNCV_122221 [Trichonephila clavipes]
MPENAGASHRGGEGVLDYRKGREPMFEKPQLKGCRLLHIDMKPLFDDELPKIRDYYSNRFKNRSFSERITIPIPKLKDVSSVLHGIGHSVADINNQHLTIGLQRLPDI